MRGHDASALNRRPGCAASGRTAAEGPRSTATSTRMRRWPRTSHKRPLEFSGGPAAPGSFLYRLPPRLRALGTHVDDVRPREADDATLISLTAVPRTSGRSASAPRGGALSRRLSRSFAARPLGDADEQNAAVPTFTFAVFAIALAVEEPSCGQELVVVALAAATGARAQELVLPRIRQRRCCSTSCSICVPVRLAQMSSGGRGPSPHSRHSWRSVSSATSRITASRSNTHSAGTVASSPRTSSRFRCCSGRHAMPGKPCLRRVSRHSLRCSSCSSGRCQAGSKAALSAPSWQPPPPRSSGSS